jgi:hypothetical protein
MSRFTKPFKDIYKIKTISSLIWSLNDNDGGIKGSSDADPHVFLQLAESASASLHRHYSLPELLVWVISKAAEGYYNTHASNYLKAEEVINDRGN